MSVGIPRRANGTFASLGKKHQVLPLQLSLLYRGAMHYTGFISTRPRNNVSLEVAPTSSRRPQPLPGASVQVVAVMVAGGEVVGDLLGVGTGHL